MEVSALKYAGGMGLHARSPLLRLQSDERLVVLVRRGNASAFEVLVSRYESRLLAFCRHLLGSREDAEDVLQEVFAAAFNAMTADDRPINVRPWLYRIARNRGLNHLRRASAVGVDSMDVHFHDNGASTADKVHEREEFRLLVGDIHELPETQKTALVLREMDALSYEQIAEAMETTVPSVKSLLVRARVSLAEAAEARLLSCDEVRIELGEVAEGLKRRPNPLVRRHLRACQRCSTFKSQLKQNNRALAAIMPLGPIVLLKKFLIAHLGHSAGSSATGAGATAGGSAASAGGAAAAGSTIVAGSTAGGFVSAGMGAIATKAAAGLAAAALVTGAAVEVDHSARSHTRKHLAALPVITHAAPTTTHVTTAWRASGRAGADVKTKRVATTHKAKGVHNGTLVASAATKATASKAAAKLTTTSTSTTTSASATGSAATATPPGRTQTQSDPTMLAPSQPTSMTASTPATTTTASSPPPPALAPVAPSDPSGPTTTTTTTPATTTTTTSAPTTTPGPGSAPPASTGQPPAAEDPTQGSPSPTAP
jgi:RNA polymerase sigma factor (sigma-70 family)